MNYSQEKSTVNGLYGKTDFSATNKTGHGKFYLIHPIDQILPLLTTNAKPPG